MARGAQPSAVAEREANEMFRYWCKVRDTEGYSGVAKKFGRSRSTVYRLAKRKQWIERHDEIREKVQKDQDNKVYREEVTNLKLVRTIRNASAKRILSKLQADPDYVPSLQTLVNLIRLEEELSQSIDPSQQDDMTTNITQIIINRMPEEQRDDFRRTIARQWRF
jgi:transposase